jgi:hypothetical protein
MPNQIQSLNAKTYDFSGAYFICHSDFEIDLTFGFLHLTIISQVFFERKE